MRIKQLTGGDRIAARFMRRDFFEYSPEFKLTVIGNHVPDLHNVDDAARRRFNLAPFTHKPPVVDKKLEEKLRSEWPAILRWMIDGCLDWRINGLIRPNAVTASTADYFSDQDLLAQWIEDCCDRDDNAVDTIASLLASWRNYTKSRGEEPGSSKGFSMALRSRGFTRIKDGRGIHGRGFQGIKVHVHTIGTSVASLLWQIVLASDRHFRRIFPIIPALVMPDFCAPSQIARCSILCDP